MATLSGQIRKDRQGSIRKVTRTPSGGARLDAALTRSGVFTYYENGKRIDEYRPPDEVFKAESLATLLGATVTHRHPPTEVNPGNFKTYAEGFNVTPVSREDDLVISTLDVNGAVALAAIESGEREISCGYTCDVDNTPGVTPEGIRFDRSQKNIQYNHIAIVERGRAGHSVALRLDAAGNELPAEDRKDQMTPEQIAKLQADLVTANTRADSEKIRADTAEAGLAVATQTVTTEKTRADSAESKLAVVAKADLHKAAKPILGKAFKADAKDEDIRKAVIAKRMPSLKLDGKDAGQLSALFEAALAIPQKRDDSEEIELAEALRVDGDAEEEEEEEDPEAPPFMKKKKKADSLDKKREDAAQKRRDSWKQPLTVSKGR